MYKTGLVLSGGATRGFAHIGAIKAMEEEGIEADVIAGTSVGALVGAMYASGYQADRMLELFRKYSLFRLSRPAFSRQGLLNFSGLKKGIDRQLEAKTFEDLKLPFYVCISNLTEGVAEYVNSGPLKEVLVASSSIPLMYVPVKIGDNLYTDGAVFDNFPVKAIRANCHKVIGINIMPRGRAKKIKGFRSTAMRVFQLYQNASDMDSWKQCDLLIEPEALSEHGYLRHNKGSAMYRLGYESAKKMLHAIP